MRNKSTKIIQYKSQAGFTMLEMLVAILIFSVCIVAMISVTANKATDSLYSKNKITASYLGEEGVEIVRHIRDTIFLQYEESGDATARWDAFLTAIDPCISLEGCILDINSAYIGDAGGDNSYGIQSYGATASNLFYDSFGFYTHYGVGGNESVFRRQVIVTPIGDNEVSVRVVVYWDQKTAKYQVEMTENLFNWF
mgnify:FL=1